jgi:hypothetical protein
VQKPAEEKLKAMYRPLANAIAARALVEFADRQAADPSSYRSLEVTMRLSVNVHKNFDYLMGYTGKWCEEPEYREAMVGVDEVRHLALHIGAIMVHVMQQATDSSCGSVDPSSPRGCARSHLMTGTVILSVGGGVRAAGSHVLCAISVLAKHHTYIMHVPTQL